MKNIEISLKNVTYCLALGLFAIGTSSCSENPIDENILEIVAENGGGYSAQVSTTISVDNLQVQGSGDLLITNPLDETKPLGRLILMSSEPGKIRLAFKINVADSIKLPVFSPASSLPNGSPFPVTDVDATRWNTLALGDEGSRVYMNFNSVTGRVVAGYALATDSLSTAAQGSFFVNYTPTGNSNLAAVGGVYSGPGLGQSGVALFVDLTSVLASSPSGSAQPMQIPPASQVNKEIVIQKVLELNKAGAVIKF